MAEDDNGVGAPRLLIAAAAVVLVVAILLGVKFFSLFSSGFSGNADVAATVPLCEAHPEACATQTVAAESINPAPGHPLPELVRDWRQAAWQRDDFYAQTKLGELYAHDPSFSDPEEAYVWYFLALRPDRSPAPGDVAQTTFDALWQKAADDQSRTYNSLTLDQRLDARKRIIYILSCRGPEGLVTLGRLHQSDAARAFGQYAPPAAPLHQCREVHSWWSWLHRDADTDCQPAGPLPGDAQSALMASDSDALMYFDVAQTMGHPLANAYVTAQSNYLTGMPGGAQMIADARTRARTWSSPFEFYPGQTRGGTLHTDECVETLFQRQAIDRAEEIPPPALLRALWLTGFLKTPRDAMVAPPLLRDAVAKFQQLVGDDVTGTLNPREMVLLIQTAASDGDADSQVELGVMYTKGIGVARNYGRAEYWFAQAANQRDGEALYYLGVLYQSGVDGVQHDADKAALYMEEAALAGFSPVRDRLIELLGKDFKPPVFKEEAGPFAGPPPRPRRLENRGPRARGSLRNVNLSFPAASAAPSVSAVSAVPLAPAGNP